MIDLRQQFAVLRRRWLLIATTVLVVLLAGLGLVLMQTTIYTASATVLINPAVITDSTGPSVEPEELASQALIVRSEAVATLVKEDVRLKESPQTLLETVVVDGVTVDGVGDPRALQISVEREDPQLAADIANAFVTAYIEVRETREIEQSLDRRSIFLEQLDRLDKEISDTTDPQELQSLNLQRADLAAQLATAESGRNPQPGAESISDAEKPTAPTQPKPVRTAALCLGLGLLLGVGLAFLRDHADDGVREEGQLQNALADAPVLGQIPRTPKSQTGRVETLLSPHSLVSEAYRGLNANVRFLLAAARDGSAEQRKIVLVSSAVSGEGKTSIATNLAVAAARVGLRVTLVDADLRNPQVANRFGLGGAPGLSDALATGVPVVQHLMDVGVEGLRVLAGGTIPPNPAELLASPATRSILNELASSSDVVVVDTAPILPVADTLELVTPQSLVLIVARKGVSRIHSLSASLGRVRQVGGHVAGSVFNDVEARNAHTYGVVEATPPSRRERKKDAERGDDSGIGLIA